MTTFRFPQIPCSHQQFRSSLPLSYPCDPVKIECKLKLQEFERLVTYQADDIGQLSVVPITPYRPTGNSTVLDPFNPFCARCHSDNVNLIKSLRHSDESSVKYLQDIKSYVRYQLSLSKEFDYNRDYWYVWDVPVYIDRVCEDDEQLRAWVELESFEDEEVKPTPASKVSIEALARSIIKKYECANCVICLEELYDNKKEGTLKVTMPCKHEFHEGCIVEWLHTSYVCPLCRFELPTTEVVDDADFY